MARAAVLFRNLSDAGVITASGAVAGQPAALLQDPHVGRRWRSLPGTSAALIIDLGAMQALDTIALIGCNLTLAGTARVRVSTNDASAQSGNAWDSGPLTGLCDPAYGYLIHLLPAPVSGRYVRIDLTDAALPDIEAGRLVVGARQQFAFNFAYGWQWGRVDRSRKTESRGGQVFISRDNSYRTAQLTFENVNEDQRYGFVEDMDRLNAEHDDVLFLTDPDSSNLGRDTIWGLVDGLEPVTQPYFDIYSKPYKLRERL